MTKRQGKFPEGSSEMRQGPRLKVSFEELSTDIDILTRAKECLTQLRIELNFSECQ